MTIQDFSSALRWMRAGDEVTVTLRSADLQRALEMASGGPEVMSTAQAADVFGWSSRRWREWAKAGRIEGAWQDERGDWRLPREACRALVGELKESGRRAPAPLPGILDSGRNPVKQSRKRYATTDGRSIRRGPR